MANKTHVFKLPESDIQITFLYLPSLNLYVITDAKGFGQNWIRVTYYRKLYDANLLMGIDDKDFFTSIARYFSEEIINRKLASNDQLTMVDEINLTFSISLRNIEPKTVRLIKEEFSKHLSA